MTTKPDITDMLERYNCPHTAAVVRMRFWGAINSPATSISPIEEFDALWRGKRRRFETEDEAQAFYDVMIRFWNALAENRVSGKLIAVALRSGLNTIDGLKSAIGSRHAELDDGFYCGFIGNLRPYDPVDSGIDRKLDKLSDVIDKIEELMEGPIGPGYFIGNLRPHVPVDSGISGNLDKLSDVIDEMEELMDAPIGPSNANKVRSRFVALDKGAQKLVNQLVMQTWVAARGGRTVH